jgi:2-C-methyl-D-erythritol 4-phosphate cytidylyltransferase
MKRFAVIVAGGSGSRMKSDIPKQFLEIAGLPVLMHTISVFKEFDPAMQIILVLPASQIDYWKGLCTKYEFNIPHEIVEGGSTRFHSVKNGLAMITEEGVIGIHDGVRPFVSIETLRNTYTTAKEKGNAVPVIDAFESVRQTLGSSNKALDRTTIKLVQTPQVFRSGQLKKAFTLPYTDEFTDDASVAEAAGFKINLVEGNRENIKITTPFDLKTGEMLLSEK